MSEPVRTCIGCRRRAGQRELLRIVADDRTVRADPSGVLPGRGAYLHPALSCVALAAKRRAFGRALRTEVDTARAERVLIDRLA